MKATVKKGTMTRSKEQALGGHFDNTVQIQLVI
jgi:hypothetical protein